LVGIKFKVPIGYHDHLCKIFDSIDVTNFDWDIITDDIIDPDRTKNISGIFCADTVDGRCLLSRITKKSYQLIFADLKAYPVGSEHKTINTFEDYISSDCQIVLLCIDSAYIDFFCKNASVLDTVHKNCLANDYENIEFLSEIEAINHYMTAF